MKKQNEYIITRKETNELFYTVSAKSRAEAIRMVEEWEVSPDDQCGISTTKPKVMRVITYDTCPNNGEAWTSQPLADYDANKIGGFGWSYNGRCEGVKQTTEGLCHVCVQAQRQGRRLLTNAEKAYLKEQYHECRNLNTE